MFEGGGAQHATFLPASDTSLRTEQGTWTPIVTNFVGSANAKGVYTRIGRRVILDFRFSYTSKSGTGNMEIRGIPYSIDFTNESYYVGSWAGDCLASGSSPYQANLLANTVIGSAGVALYVSDISTGTLTLVTATAMDNTGTMVGHIEYETSDSF